jgi:hypothetical protein
MLAVALEAEVDGYVAGFEDERDEDGKRLVTRNGHAESRTITTAADGFKSLIVPPCRRGAARAGRCPRFCR